MTSIKVVWVNTRWPLRFLLAVAKMTSFQLCIPNRNKAVVILTLLPVQRLFNGSWSHHLGKQCWGKTKQVTPLAMPSLLVPRSLDKLRGANHNFTLWFVKSHSSTGGTQKTFKSINFMAYRITAFPYCSYCSMLAFSSFVPLTSRVRCLLCKWKGSCNFDQNI